MLQGDLGLLVVELLPLLHLLPLLGAPVLEPDLHLALGEPQVGGELRFPPDGYVPAVVELLLEFHALVVRVHDPVFVFRPRLAWNSDKGVVLLGYLDGLDKSQGEKVTGRGVLWRGIRNQFYV